MKSITVNAPEGTFTVKLDYSCPDDMQGFTVETKNGIQDHAEFVNEDGRLERTDSNLKLNGVHELRELFDAKYEHDVPTEEILDAVEELMGV